MKLDSNVPLGHLKKEELEQLKIINEAFVTKVEDFMAKSSDLLELSEMQAMQIEEERSNLIDTEKELIDANKKLNEAIHAIQKINERAIMRNVEKLQSAANEFRSRASNFTKHVTKPAMDKLVEIEKKLSDASAAIFNELFTMTEELCVQIAALCHDLGKPVSSSFIL